MAVIALYDSGIGGIPVLSALVRALPDETFLFYGDNLNMPYGNKSREELCGIASVNLDYLSGFAPDVLLFACNTLSTALPKGTLSRCVFPVVGLSPPFPPERRGKKAEILSKDGKVSQAKTEVFPPENPEENDLSDCLLLSTPLTAKSSYVERARKRGLRVVAAEKLAENVERFYYDEDPQRWEKALRPLDLSSVKTLYLGCTHYLWLEPYLRRKYPELRIEDGVSDAIKRVKKALKKQGVPFAPAKSGEKTDKNGNPDVFAPRAAQRNAAGEETGLQNQIPAAENKPQNQTTETEINLQNQIPAAESSQRNQIVNADSFSQNANAFSAAASGVKTFGVKAPGGKTPAVQAPGDNRRACRKAGNGAGFSYTAKPAVRATVHFVGECSVQNQNAYLFFNKQTF